jgi:hypothetical protein
MRHAGPFGGRNQLAQQADVVHQRIARHERRPQEERGFIAEAARGGLAPQAVAALLAERHLRQHLGRARTVGARPLRHRPVREQPVGHHQPHALGQAARLQPLGQHVHTTTRHLRPPDRVGTHASVLRHVERHGEESGLIRDAVDLETRDGTGGDGHGDLPCCEGRLGTARIPIQRPSGPKV